MNFLGNVLPSHCFPECSRYNIKRNTLGAVPACHLPESSIQYQLGDLGPHPGQLILEVTEGVQQGTFLYNGKCFNCIPGHPPTWPGLCLTLQVWKLHWMSLGKWPIPKSINTARWFSALWVIPRPEMGSLENHTLRISTLFLYDCWRTSKSLNSSTRDWFWSIHSNLHK